MHRHNLLTYYLRTKEGWEITATGHGGHILVNSAFRKLSQESHEAGVSSQPGLHSKTTAQNKTNLQPTPKQTKRYKAHILKRDREKNQPTESTFILNRILHEYFVLFLKMFEKICFGTVAYTCYPGYQ